MGGFNPAWFIATAIGLVGLTELMFPERLRPTIRRFSLPLAGLLLVIGIIGIGSDFHESYQLRSPISAHGTRWPFVARHGPRPKDYGTLTLPGKFESLNHNIEIGDSGAQLWFLTTDEDAIAGWLKRFLVGFSLRLGTGPNGQLLVSAIIRDDTGRAVATLDNNEWTDAGHPQAWDRNYTNDALEVIGPGDSVVLQIRLLPDRIQLQGESWDSSGRGVRITEARDSENGKRYGAIVYLVKGAGAGPCNARLPIRPMFQYPSRSHFHEYASKAVLPDLTRLAHDPQLQNCSGGILVLPRGNYALAPRPR